MTPGAALRFILKQQGWTQAALARALGRPLKTINEIVQDKAGISPETALQLEEVGLKSADYWLSLDATHRLNQARERRYKARIIAESMTEGMG